MLPLCRLTGLGPLTSSSSKTGMCRALLWLGWTYGSGGASTLHTTFGVLGPAEVPCTHPTLTRSNIWTKWQLRTGCCQSDDHSSLSATFFWELLIWRAVRWMNRSGRDSCSTYPPSGWQGVPTKVDFYEVQFWQPCLVLECSFVGEEKSAFLYIVSFYCYRRDNIATIISKVQSHKAANSRLQYINKW